MTCWVVIVVVAVGVVGVSVDRSILSGYFQDSRALVFCAVISQSATRAGVVLRYEGLRFGVAIGARVCNQGS